MLRTFLPWATAMGIIALTAHPSPAFAQATAAFQRAELAELSPEKRAEVEARATGGNSIREVLEVMLLNGIKLKYPANKIVALDFGRGAAVVEMTDNALRVINFDKTTLAIN